MSKEIQQLMQELHRLADVGKDGDDGWEDTTTGYHRLQLDWANLVRSEYGAQTYNMLVEETECLLPVGKWKRRMELLAASSVVKIYFVQWDGKYGAGVELHSTEESALSDYYSQAKDLGYEGPKDEGSICTWIDESWSSGAEEDWVDMGFQHLDLKEINSLNL